MARAPRRRQYGIGSIDLRSPGNWRVRWYGVDGSRKSQEGFATRAEADAGAKVILEGLRKLQAGLSPSPSSVPALSVWAAGWLEARSNVLRANRDDRYRWTNHLEPVFGHLRPSEVDAEKVEKFVRDQRAAGDLAPETIGHCVRLLSRIFTSLVTSAKRSGVTANPVHSLSREVRRLYKSGHDPRNTPFVERVEDVTHIVKALPQPYSTLYAVGVYTGMRPGEAKALAWPDISLERRTIKIWRAIDRDGNLGPLKDDETRFVPILDPLLPILLAWRAATGGTGFLFPSPRQRMKRTAGKDAALSFVRGNTYLAALRAVLQPLALPRLDVYQATRHTFASQWVMADGSIAKLAAILGHSTTEVTKRYAHLIPGRFSANDLARLGSPGPKNGEIRSELGPDAAPLKSVSTTQS